MSRQWCGPSVTLSRMLFFLELALGLLCLGAALWLQPWRMLAGPLLTPALAAWPPAVVVAAAQHMPQGLACAVFGREPLGLMLGWPLAVLVLKRVPWGLGSARGGAALAVSQWVWIGLTRHARPVHRCRLRPLAASHPFVYTLGRGFLGTAAAVFLSGLLMELIYGCRGRGAGTALVRAGSWPGRCLPHRHVLRHLRAFAPRARTWSDERYLHPTPRRLSAFGAAGRRPHAAGSGSQASLSTTGARRAPARRSTAGDHDSSGSAGRRGTHPGAEFDVSRATVNVPPAPAGGSPAASRAARRG